MKYEEVIKILATPLEWERPPIDEVIARLAELGLSFESRDENCLWLEHCIVHSEYREHSYEQIRQQIESLGLPGTVMHTIRPLYEDVDWAQAPLWGINTPEIKVPHAKGNWSRCAQCSRENYQWELPRSVAQVKSDRAFGSYGSNRWLLSAAGRKALEAEKWIDGITLKEFDLALSFFEFDVDTTLDDPIFTRAESRGFQGKCPLCSAWVFEQYFGPARFHRQTWKGQDFVRGEGLFSVLYCTPMAFKALSRVEPEIKRLEPLFFE
jgi:hypothetical protein